MKTRAAAPLFFLPPPPPPSEKRQLLPYSSYPQLYVGGEFVGGCDIVLELAQSGELLPTIRPPGHAAAHVTAPELEGMTGMLQLKQQQSGPGPRGGPSPME